MQSLTDLILKQNGWGHRVEKGFIRGVEHFSKGNHTDIEQDSKEEWSFTREGEGLSRHTPDILTPPNANLKLAKGSVPTYGLTLQHYVTHFDDIKLTVNACPSAGDCTKVCVLNSGNGLYPMVQKARRARTKMWVSDAPGAAFLLGYELAKAVKQKGEILFRPNVNSDVEWQLIFPSLMEGNLFDSSVISYGYTKLPSVLSTNGWLGKRYRVSYSYSEKTTHGIKGTYPFLDTGGSVAVVTNRKRTEKIKQWGGDYKVVDADKTDEWMFKSSVIGDLSAKGKARSQVGKTNFIHEVY